ncbi:MAG: hypothetical protein ABI051_01610, partial [Vicinamibacterales bacterium]
MSASGRSPRTARRSSNASGANTRSVVPSLHGCRSERRTRPSLRPGTDRQPVEQRGTIGPGIAGHAVIVRLATRAKPAVHKGLDRRQHLFGVER